MHKCKRSTSRYSCKVTLNSVPWIESFVKAAISLQITAEGNTVDKKTAFGLGLDYIQSFTCELALLPYGLLSTYLFFPTRNGQSKFDQNQIWNKLLPTGASPGAIFLYVIVQVPSFFLQFHMFQFIQLLGITSKFRPLMPSQVMSRTLPFDLQVQCRSSGHLSPDPCCFNLPLSCTPEIMKWSCEI